MGGQGAANMRMAINMVPSFGDFYVTTTDGVRTVGNCTMPVNPSPPRPILPSFPALARACLWCDAGEITRRFIEALFACALNSR